LFRTRNIFSDTKLLFLEQKIDLLEHRKCFLEQKIYFCVAKKECCCSKTPYSCSKPGENCSKNNTLCSKYPFFGSKKRVVRSKTGVFCSGKKNVDHKDTRRHREHVEKVPDYLYLRAAIKKSFPNLCVLRDSVVNRSPSVPRPRGR
jgi:hypothetical protein